MALAKPRPQLPPAENAARIGAAIDAVETNAAGLAREVALRTAGADAEAAARRSGDLALADRISAAANGAAGALRQEIAAREAAEAGVLAETQQALATPMPACSSRARAGAGR